MDFSLFKKSEFYKKDRILINFQCSLDESHQFYRLSHLLKVSLLNAIKILILRPYSLSNLSQTSYALWTLSKLTPFNIFQLCFKRNKDINMENASSIFGAVLIN